MISIKIILVLLILYAASFGICVLAEWDHSWEYTGTRIVDFYDPFSYDKPRVLASVVMPKEMQHKWSKQKRRASGVDTASGIFKCADGKPRYIEFVEGHPPVVSMDTEGYPEKIKLQVYCKILDKFTKVKENS